MLSFHMDLKSNDRFFWFTTTGWMMWNVLVSGLLTGSAILMFDGNPGYPDLNVLWQFAEDTQMTVFGTSASYITSCMQANLKPSKTVNLKALKLIGSTGSPLPDNGFKWVYENVNHNIWLSSTSGGTDLCAALVGGVPILPVRAGEIQCRNLGAAVQAFNDNGDPVIDQVGELVVTKPMPSMPLYFWNDQDGKRYHESYFNMFPGVWRHGDWIKITSNGSAIMYGRSDSTINRGGVRMGTSEIYSVVESIDEIIDSLVVDIQNDQDEFFLPLFVVLKEGKQLTDDLKTKIRQYIKRDCSPRHVPSEIYGIPEVPRTLNGKKLEVPIKKILMGIPVNKVVNRGSLGNPHTLDVFINMAKKKLL